MTTPTPTLAAPVLPGLLPLTCRCTGAGLDRAVAADLVADLCTTPEGPMARLAIVLPDHAAIDPLGAPLTLWLSPWELNALLLQLAELHDFAHEPA